MLSTNVKKSSLNYITLVRPHTEYCVQPWSPYLAKNVDTLEKVQHRASKLIPNITHLSYSDRLRELNMYSLEDRCNRGDMMGLFKLIKHTDRINLSGMFKLSNSSITRKHDQMQLLC